MSEINDKQDLLNNLQLLIEQTYSVENEYKNLRKSYDDLILILNEVIEIIPSAIWLLNNDEIVFKNNLANKELFKQINTNNEHYELEFNDDFYQIKCIKYHQKTLILATNITTEKRNERLVSMGQVAASLAHEIRNPIGSISLLADVLAAKISYEQKHIVIQMKDAIKRVERNITSILLFTKELKLSTSIFNAKELSAECFKIFFSYNQNKELEFSCNFSNVMIKADKALMLIVLSNLIYNACDELAESKGQIKINAKKNKDFYLISVFDSAKEITNTKNLFNAFSTTKLKGNGLGLALSKQIINAHKGELFYKNNPKAFCIKLPLN